MIPSRQSKEDNPYFDKPPELLREHLTDLELQSQRAYDFYLTLEAAKIAVQQAIDENTIRGVSWE